MSTSPTARNEQLLTSPSFRRMRSSLSSSVPLVIDPQAGPSNGGTSTPSSGRSAAATVVQSPTTLDGLAHLAFAEVESLRSTIEGLKHKVTSLESLLVTAFGRAKEDPERRTAVEMSLQQPHQHQHHLKTEQFTPSAPFPTPLPTSQYLPHSPSFDPHTGGILISHPSASASPALSSYAPPSASMSTYNLPPMDPTRANCGFPESSALPKPETVSGEDSLREEEVAASLSLEYMALGRRRASAQLPVRPYFVTSLSLSSADSVRY